MEGLSLAAGIPLVIGFMLTAAFFSGSETGLYCVNRLRLRLLAEGGETSAKLLQGAVRRQRSIISTILVGTNLGLYMATTLVTAMLYPHFEQRSQFIAGMLLPPVLLIFADMMPKTLMQKHADRMMYYNIWPLRLFEVLFFPLAALLRAVSTLPQLIFRKSRSRKPPAVTPESFRLYLREGADQGVLSGFQRAMAMNILRMRKMPLSQAMAPLDRAVMISADATGHELLGLLKAHRYSRIPVFEGQRSNVIGVLNVIDVGLVEDGPPPIREIMREPVALEQTMPVSEALRRMREQRQPFAMVVDETGAAVGLASIKDLVEEIVGELRAW
jgi:CBS domain containing-hemolysin-like protein